jgi:putative hydrolase of HD superfamily
MKTDRLEKQIQFIVEMDKLKRVSRQTLIMDRSRQENSAEHSWHIALMALVLSEYAKEKGTDFFRVLKMLLVHDLVEIDAGDTYCYDDTATRDQQAREIKAADRIFNILPPDQAREFRSLWDEFEARNTPDARFAVALDRLQPILQNYNTGGDVWKKNAIGADQVLSRNQIIETGAPRLWDYAVSLINRAAERGLLAT